MKEKDPSSGKNAGAFVFRVLLGIGVLALLFWCVEVASVFYMLWGAPETESGTLPEEAGVVLRSGNAESDQLALTCNVDWGEDVLPQMLETFREKDVQVTFFVTGRWALNHPDLVRKMYAEGHDVQNHGYSHKLCSRSDRETVESEVKQTQDMIEKLLGYKTDLFAPPSGDYDGKTVALCREAGYRLCLWSTDTIDWKAGSTAAVIRERVLNKPLSGAVVLMHPKEETARALPDLIDEIRTRGIEIVPLRTFADQPV